jgi:hypothetical protein
LLIAIQLGYALIYSFLVLLAVLSLACREATTDPLADSIGLSNLYFLDKFNQEVLQVMGK